MDMIFIDLLNTNPMG